MDARIKAAELEPDSPLTELYARLRVEMDERRAREAEDAALAPFNVRG